MTARCGTCWRVSEGAMERHEHQPGEPASRAGRYDELNVFGTPTGKVAHVGEELPNSPRGFSWRHAAP
jgi:hypothetical protein